MTPESSRTRAHVDPIDVDTRALELFVLLAEHRHYGSAARAASIAQPALSQHIKRLESTLALRLFDRTTRTVELTAAGRALMPHAREIIAELASLERLRHRFDRLRTGAVRLGISTPMGMTTADRIAAGLADRLWGRHELQVVELRPHELRRALADGAIDLALSLDATALADLGGVSAPIAFDPRSVVVPRSHPLARRRRIELAELRHEVPLALDPDEFGSAELWRPSELPPADGIVGDVGELRDALILQRGICLLPDADAAALVDDSLTRIPVVDAPPVSYALAWCGDTPPLPEDLLLGGGAHGTGLDAHRGTARDADPDLDPDRGPAGRRA
ncbi:LysR family transcriptional regulator [Schumannella luteola]|uniref:DNA-binding transcriptional LysR family regulator n=1 Tax=Schumannella luteola TaxID=472059 RepID=A0A852YAT6_9MICO|nr:LysR family transcriptional regulator [Schumannella luteola]NYG98470.1 DNA-binding transcriptional LysR family regulator [Schumannella luteola]TPX01304.1 LysR family transcriptional regulator [Schumannella luteola]